MLHGPVRIEFSQYFGDCIIDCRCKFLVHFYEMYIFKAKYWIYYTASIVSIQAWYQQKSIEYKIFSIRTRNINTFRSIESIIASIFAVK